MKKTYVLIVSIIALALISFLCYKNNPSNKVKECSNVINKEQNNTIDIENKIREFYNITDVLKDIDKYNKMVTDKAKLTKWNIPDNVENRKILEIKEVNYNDYTELKQEVDSKYSQEKDSVRYFMVGFDIKYKEGKATVSNSGVYYVVMTLEKQNREWLITNSTHQATYKNGNLSIDS